METHGRDLRFLGLFILFLGIYYFISTTSTVKDRFFPWYLEANAQASVTALSAFGYPDVTRQGTSVSSPRGTITVARGCDAMEPVALFVSAVLASPVSFSSRLLAAVAGTALLLTINLVRIISLFLCAAHWRSAFDIMHLDVWQALFIFLAIFLWAIWAAWAVKRHRRKHVSATA
jgi:exosortase/archaeosortase family protein